MREGSHRPFQVLLLGVEDLLDFAVGIYLGLVVHQHSQVLRVQLPHIERIYLGVDFLEPGKGLRLELADLLP